MKDLSLLYLPGTEEAERIKKCKGRVFALKDEPEVARVWLPNYDSPGLAMARAFGDFCLKDFGLISVPEVSHRRLTKKDEFIVLATDGVNRYWTWATFDLFWRSLLTKYHIFHDKKKVPYLWCLILMWVNFGRSGMYFQMKKW